METAPAEAAAGTPTDRRPAVHIHVALDGDRQNTGFIMVIDDRGTPLAGPFRVLGRADGATAAGKRNPDRTPTRPYGDTPTGQYSVPEGGVFPTGNGTNYQERSFGTNGAIRMEGVDGDALIAAENGRTGLLIHGGDLNAAGRLRPTYGCLRVRNDAMRAIMNALDGRQPAWILVVEDEAPPIQDLPIPESVPGAAAIIEPDAGGTGWYIANRRTKQVHNADQPCAWVKQMNPANREPLDGLPEGYDWCGHCYA